MIHRSVCAFVRGTTAFWCCGELRGVDSRYLREGSTQTNDEHLQFNGGRLVCELVACAHALLSCVVRRKAGGKAETLEGNARFRHMRGPINQETPDRTVGNTPKYRHTWAEGDRLKACRVMRRKGGPGEVVRWMGSPRQPPPPPGCFPVILDGVRAVETPRV